MEKFPINKNFIKFEIINSVTRFSFADRLATYTSIYSLSFIKINYINCLYALEVTAQLTHFMKNVTYFNFIKFEIFGYYT